MPKRIEVNDPNVHLDDVAFDAVQEATKTREPVTVVYGRAETVIEPDTKVGPAAITARLLNADGR
ncbi:hypothetical protein GCM10023195_51000 [Actinoallomurus liliacearum]|uniref:Uncharacterized protein n=1 Tax=Actinoallomurus liliacearum TaxID=1080073 RepID=A0ABP8TR10_9ACTN